MNSQKLESELLAMIKALSQTVEDNGHHLFTMAHMHLGPTHGPMNKTQTHTEQILSIPKMDDRKVNMLQGHKRLLSG